jgi:hypothetical protein
VNKIYSSPRYYTRSSRRWINSESGISSSTVASADSSRIDYKNIIHVLFEAISELNERPGVVTLTNNCKSEGRIRISGVTENSALLIRVVSIGMPLPGN